jgi:predicted component of type VI protein secretion system
MPMSTAMTTEKPQRVTSFLVVRDGASPDWVAIWDTVEITVGRHDSQDIEVRDAEVSRKHCVFRQKGGLFTLEDLGSALGTKVNGHPIKVHELKSGDVAEIGSLKVKFGQTPNPIKPGSQQGRNVRFASQLKRLASKAPESAENGRTMMAIDLDDSMAGAPSTLPKTVPRARAVSLDGQLEELEDPNALSLAPQARNLDAEIDDGLGPATDAAPLSPPPVPPPLPRASSGPGPAPLANRGPLPPTTAPRAASGEARVQLVLEVAGPAEQVEALIAAVCGKPIQVYPLTLFVKDTRS